MSVIKRLPIIFLMMIFLIPVGNSADHTSAEHVLSSDEEGKRDEAPCVNGECSGSSGDSIAVDDRGWWLTGTLVGQQGSREWVDGVLWSSGELEVHTSTKEQLSSYPSFQYSLSVEEQNSELWQGVTDIQDSRSLVFSFRSKAFWGSPFSTESNFILTGISDSDESFFDSRSFEEFPKGVEAGWDYRSTWFFREKVSRGLVTRVQRINRRLLSNQCIIDIHLGGSRNIVHYRNEWIPEQNTGRETDIEETRNYLISRKEYSSVPDVGQFTTYQESLCRYAEDAALSNQEVNILYSDFWDSIESLVEAELYKIWVETSE